MHLTKRHSAWHICYNVGREKYSVSTRTSDRKAALRALHSFRAPTSEPITIEQFLSAYHEHLRVTRAPTSVVRSEAMQRAFSKHIAATRRLSTLTTRDVETFKLARLRAEISPHTLNSDLRHLKASLRVAVKWGYLDKAPEVELIRSPERAVPFFTLDDLDKLLAAATKDWVRRFILFAFRTGMRRNEILYLKRSNIDFARRLAYVRNTDEFTTKSKRERIVPLNATAYAIARDGEGEYLFADERGRWITPNRITCAVKEAIRAAKLDDKLHLHSLRHTFCTVLLQAGASFQEVQKLAGRSTVAVTQLYNHMVSETLHHAVEKPDRHGSPEPLLLGTSRNSRHGGNSNGPRTEISPEI